MNQWLSTFEEILKTLISPLEWIMLFAIVGGGLFLTFQSKGYPFLKIKTAFGLLLTKKKTKGFLDFKHCPLYLLQR